MSTTNSRLRRLLPAALLFFLLALPATAADQAPAPDAQEELAALMTRVTRGKKNLDKAYAQDAPGLRLASFKRAALALKHVRADLRAKEGSGFEALAEEASTLLVRAHNGLTRLYLERGDLRRARQNNALALALREDDATTKELAEEILAEETRRAPAAPEPIPVAEKREERDDERVVYVRYVSWPHTLCDLCRGSSTVLGLGYPSRVRCTHHRITGRAHARGDHGRFGRVVRRRIGVPSYGPVRRTIAGAGTGTTGQTGEAGRPSFGHALAPSFGVFRARRPASSPTTTGGVDRAYWFNR